jgi:hypothetical protein
MSRQDDERELRKLEYLDKRGVATWSDKKRQKELARKLAIQDFEASEQLRDARAGFHGRAADKSVDSSEKKGSTN